MVTEIIGELEGKGKALNQYSRFNDLPLEYDTNGNLSAKGSRLFAYDYKNRLIRSSKGDDAVTFTYDIFGRQTSRTDLSGTLHFFYAGDQKIEERNASGQVTKHYLWGNGIDELLRLDIYNGTSSTPYYIHTDNIGSTTAITDGSGNLVERVTYDVYGLPTFTDALGQTLKKSTIRNTTLFQGREYDYDLALYNYRARYFDPTMGRFLQTDPLSYQDSMNLYQGMGMNPVNFVDPWGLYGIDFHYYVIYFLMRAKGWDKETSNRVAGFSQYVDDNSETTSMFTTEASRSYWHFPGSSRENATRRDDLDSRNKVISSVKSYLKGELKGEVLLGSALHIYADSWAHEGFTGYISGLNKRTGSIRPNIGHADAAYGGHEPDMIPLNTQSSQKALEAAENIYMLLPNGSEKSLSWDEVRNCLYAAFQMPKKAFKEYKSYTYFVIAMVRYLLVEKFGEYELIEYNFEDFEKIDDYIDFSLRGQK